MKPKNKRESHASSYFRELKYIKYKAKWKKWLKKNWHRAMRATGKIKE